MAGRGLDPSSGVEIQVWLPKAWFSSFSVSPKDRRIRSGGDNQDTGHYRRFLIWASGIFVVSAIKEFVSCPNKYQFIVWHDQEHLISQGRWQRRCVCYAGEIPSSLSSRERSSSASIVSYGPFNCRFVIKVKLRWNHTHSDEMVIKRILTRYDIQSE